MTEDKLCTRQGQIYGTSRRKTEKVWRLVTPWSEQNLAHLPTMQRVAQEREMENVYETFDEKGLDTALAIMERARSTSEGGTQRRRDTVGPGEAG
jgi:hypothetical protein